MPRSCPAARPRPEGRRRQEPLHGQYQVRGGPRSPPDVLAAPRPGAPRCAGGTAGGGGTRDTAGRMAGPGEGGIEGARGGPSDARRAPAGDYGMSGRAVPTRGRRMMAGGAAIVPGRKRAAGGGRGP